MTPATYERVRVAIAETGVEVSDISPKTRFVQMGIDSLELAQLILDLEEEFGMEIPDDDLKNLFTPQDIANYVDSHSHTR